MIKNWECERIILDMIESEVDPDISILAMETGIRFLDAFKREFVRSCIWQCEGLLRVLSFADKMFVTLDKFGAVVVWTTGEDKGKLECRKRGSIDGGRSLCLYKLSDATYFAVGLQRKLLVMNCSLERKHEEKFDKEAIEFLFMAPDSIMACFQDVKFLDI